MLNRSASLAMSTSILKALPGKLDIKRHLSQCVDIPYRGSYMSAHVLLDLLNKLEKSDKI